MKPPLIMLCFIYIIHNNEMGIKMESVPTAVAKYNLIRTGTNSTIVYPEETTIIWKRGNDTATQIHTKLPAEEFPKNSSLIIPLSGDTLNNSDPCMFKLIHDVVTKSLNDTKSSMAQKMGGVMRKYRQVMDNMSKSIQGLLRSSNELLKLLNTSELTDLPTSHDSARLNASAGLSLHNVSLPSSVNVNCSKLINSECCSAGGINNGTRVNVSADSSSHNVSLPSSGNVNCSKSISRECCSAGGINNGTRVNVSADASSHNASLPSSGNMNCSKPINKDCCSVNDNGNSTHSNVSADASSHNVSLSSVGNVNCTELISRECCLTSGNNSDTHFNVSADSSLHNVSLSSSDNLNSSKLINRECCSTSDVLVVCAAFLFLLIGAFVAYKTYQKYFPSVRPIEHQTLVESGIYNNPL